MWMRKRGREGAIGHLHRSGELYSFQNKVRQCPNDQKQTCHHFNQISRVQKSPVSCVASNLYPGLGFSVDSFRSESSRKHNCQRQRRKLVDQDKI